MDPPPGRPPDRRRAGLSLRCRVAVRVAGVHGTPRRGRRAALGRNRRRRLNALAESTIGLFKTELFKPHGPWRTAEQIEIGLLEWVDWYNHRRLHEHCGDIPPAELEAAHYRHHPDLAEAGSSTN